MRTFEPEAMEDLRRRLDYSPTWWDKLKQWAASWWPSLGDGSEVSLQTMDNIQKVFVYGSVAVGALVLAWMLFRADLAGIWAARPKRALDDVRITDEKLGEIDFEKAIDDAVAQKNYRLAVRYSYLKLLKFLADKGLIAYQAYKTNRQYVRELNEPLRSGFRDLTRRFDYAWYGNRPVSEAEFGEGRRAFAEMESLAAKLQP